MEPIKKKKKLSISGTAISGEELVGTSGIHNTSQETKKFNKLNEMVELEGAEDELADFEEQDEASDASEKDELTCDANDVIHFRIVRNESDIEQQYIDTNDVEHHHKLMEFQPQFTYQIFGEEEKIEGYENLRINFYFTKSLYCWFNVQYDSKSDDATDIKSLFAAKELEFQFSNFSSIPLYFPYTENLSEFKSKINQPNTPKGEQIDVYYRDGKVFEIYKCTMSQIGALHKPWQFLCLFFIEGTSFIDDQDHQWEFFLVYEKVKDHENNFEYIPVGFSSIYPFFTMRKEDGVLKDRRRLRVSQFLILPPFQRQGHGIKLLRAIYTYALKGYKEQKSLIGYNALYNAVQDVEEKSYDARECYEVTVENPGDEFQLMRNRVDLEVCTPIFKAARRKAATSDEKEEGETFEEFKSRAKPLTKLSDNQLRTCFEVLWLKNLNDNVNTTQNDRNELKLFIKKRLYSEYDMEGAFDDHKERKEKLEELCDEELNEYKVLLK